MAQILGPRLRKVLRLASGRLVAVVDRTDPVIIDTTSRLGVMPIGEQTERILTELGGDSAFSTAAVVVEQPPMAPGTLDQLERRERFSICHRKLRAAETLAAAQMGAETIEQARAAMAALIRALACEPGSTGGEAELPTPQLLFEILIPRKILTLEEAALASRAEGLASAYSASPQGPPPETVRTVIADARRLLEDHASAPNA